MCAALTLARRGLGRVWPNPAVGCVIVRDGIVLGRGWTQPGGRPHAEIEALARAGRATKGADAYVTLEPCCHHGKTPPCTDALIAAGIRRVIVAVEDPDPRVAGKGLKALRAAGINVVSGVSADAAAEINAGFFSTITRGRPLVTLKLSTSLDGRLAVASGASRWITGEAARARSHLLRTTHDAVMVGSGTVIADDPELTCRLPGLTDRSPVRVVIDGGLRVPLTARVVADARRAPTWFIVRNGIAGERRAALAGCGVEVIDVPAMPGGETDLAAALSALAMKGITRVLVEGGATLAAALVRADLVDRIAWFQAPSLIGGDGLPALNALGIEAPGQAPRFVRIGIESVGEDVLETLRRAN
ncbi:MAG: bifunctional diaminohydroxyphosphoribosylaminopyrimidine deaminase/5-amino-6-(5-phosphoribosylamino)uracil reductase RibD [Alphaproteobacteria bacterium]|nr:bifunctional diaminohydroxyphosphoribosylaminopyrimidine deaminase/5-amino-6-(5-phosphoribosylamino)uracil reductase RibD [Alphaproteobacteria bacterium]